MPSRKLRYVNGGIERPDRIKISKDDLTIEWDLDEAAVQHLARIIFPANPPAPYEPWPGSPPVTSGNGKKITATGVKLEPGQGDKVLYKYDIIWGNPAGALDPDIENNVGNEPDGDEDQRHSGHHKKP